MTALCAVCVSLGNMVESNAQDRESNDSTFLQVTNLTDAGAALQGRFSGLLVMNPSGAPGETAKLRVRGFTSETGNGGPLLIVDGLKVENIQHLDPSMIESVEVLKDGASTALYGVQGGNGVILITTKKGEGKFSVGYDFKLTSSSLGKRADLMNAEEWLQNRKKNYGNYYDFSKYTADTDWQDFVYGNGFAHQHGLNLQAGNDKGGFFAAFNYLDNDGIVKGSADTHRRIAGKANGSYRFTDWLEVGINASFATQDISYIAQQIDYGSSLFSAVINATPARDPYTSESNGNPNMLKDPSNGKYYLSEDSNVNPFVRRDSNQRNAVQKDLNGIMYARLTPFENFAFTARGGYRMEQQNRNESVIPYYASESVNNDRYSLSVAERSNNGYQADALAEYTLAKGLHRVDFKAGAYYESVVKTTRYGVSVSNTAALKYEDININSRETKFSDLGFLAQADYSFAGRYNIQAGIRTDKYTSGYIIGKIYEEKPWILYPAVSAGWTISNESFFSGVNPTAISHLELNASWGKGGSTADIEALWNPITAVWIETSQQMNIGVETSMLNGRLGIAVDWFDKKTEIFTFMPEFLPVQEPSSIENNGIDIDLIWKDKIGDFGYSVAGNLSTLKNTVTSLGQEIFAAISGTSKYGYVNTRSSVGMPMWYFYGYPEGSTEWREDKRDYIGQGIPTSYFGLSINMTYKGFDLNIHGNGTAGNSIAYCMYDPSRLTSNSIKDFNSEEWSQNASRLNESYAAVFDGSYFRIRQLQLGYTIPSRIVRKIFMQNARVFVSLDDWFTFSKYPGGDPETATAGSKLTFTTTPMGSEINTVDTYGDKALGIDYGSYPMSKKLIFGLSIRF